MPPRFSATFLRALPIFSSTHPPSMHVLLTRSPCSWFVRDCPLQKGVGALLQTPACVVESRDTMSAPLSFTSHSCCLHSALSPAPQTSVSPSTPVDLSAVPEVYHDINAVFSKKHAHSLPHHSYHGHVHVPLPGPPLPSSHLYNLSRPEHEAMKRYISESLAFGLVRSSSAPVGAGFFFVKKKDGRL